ncbi:MAG TPA: SURF1 family protein [Burkholderiaceae bacterium]|nr:SURF1 family protein [Burkholderiaceae bacterium]
MKLRAVVPTLAALALVAVTVSLGNWQMRRADEKRALHARHEAASRDAVVRVPAGDLDPASLEGRRVVARGELLPRWTVFVDNRTHKGIAGFYVLSPLRMTGSERHVLVLRGWVASDPRERSRLPDLATPAGEVEIEGIAQLDLEHVLELGRSAPPGPQDRLWQNADVASFARWSGLAMQPLVVRETVAPRVGADERDDGLVRDWPDPGSGVEKHLGYAFQWYALAVLAAGLWARFVLFGRRKAES